MEIPTVNCHINASRLPAMDQFTTIPHHMRARSHSWSNFADAGGEPSHSAEFHVVARYGGSHGVQDPTEASLLAACSPPYLIERRLVVWI